MEALIDADLIGYRCACTCEEDTTNTIVLSRVQELTERIIANATADTFTLYLTGNNNFRKEINPEYKANRKGKPLPKWLDTCREFLVTEWGAKVTEGYEADDALGIEQTDQTIICSLDKDLLMIPGMHYNWVKEETKYISPEQGLKHFWTQMIVGDTADNIFGIRGLGPVKAERALANVEGDSLEELDSNYYDIVKSLYNDDLRLHVNGSCLWILRHESDIWLAPGSSVERTTRESIVASLKQTLLKPLVTMD